MDKEKTVSQKQKDASSKNWQIMIRKRYKQVYLFDDLDQKENKATEKDKGERKEYLKE